MNVTPSSTGRTSAHCRCVKAGFSRRKSTLNIRAVRSNVQHISHGIVCRIYAENFHSIVRARRSTYTSRLCIYNYICAQVILARAQTCIRPSSLNRTFSHPDSNLPSVDAKIACIRTLHRRAACRAAIVGCTACALPAVAARRCRA